MTTDPLVAAARALIERGADGYVGPQVDEFVDEVSRLHGAGALYKRATAKAIAGRDVAVGTPAAIAEGVYRNFIWTHFVCKLLMTASPVTALHYAHDNFDISDLQSRVETTGSAILSCFHYTAYPLMAMHLAISSVAPLISKARVDFLEKSPERLSDHVIYLSDRSAPLRMTRALQQGKCVWVLLDVVLPMVRVLEKRFLGGTMKVSAGIDTIARLSARPCVPLFWELSEAGATVRTGNPIFQTEEDNVIQDFVDTQAEFIARHPTQWLEWYSVLDEAASVRAEVKQANEALWARLTPALPEQHRDAI